jgi:hypothetical protein
MANYYYGLELRQQATTTTYHKVPEGRFYVGNPGDALCTLGGAKQHVNISRKRGLRCTSLRGGGHRPWRQSCHVFHDRRQRRDRVVTMCQIRQLAYDRRFNASGSTTSADTDLPLGDASGSVHSWIEKRPGSASWRQNAAAIQEGSMEGSSHFDGHMCSVSVCADGLMPNGWY